MTEPKNENEISEMFPYLIVRGATAAIEFYKRAFGAEEMARLAEPSGRIGHAQIKLGSAVVMLADEFPEKGIFSPLAYGGTGSALHLHVANVDEMTKQAAAAGAKILQEPKDQFYGERSSKLLDPYGHQWMLGSHIEDVSLDEMQQRYSAILSKTG
jgi:PhnB protein